MGVWVTSTVCGREGGKYNHMYLGGPATGLEVLQRFMEEEASKKKSNLVITFQ